MKLRKRIAASFAAAAVAVTLIPAVPSAAKIDMDDLPVPISDTSKAKEAKAFTKIVPKLSQAGRNDHYYYYYYYSGRELTWKKVDGALLYEIYKKDKDSGSYKKIGSTLDTYYYVGEDGDYKICAVTYTYADQKVSSKFSNSVKVESKRYSYYDDDEDTGWAEGSEEYTEEDYDDDDAEIAVGEGIDYNDIAVGEAPSFVATSQSVNKTGGYKPFQPNTEEYSHNEESGYKKAALDPLSTFSADVDTASYANLRRLINDDDPIPEDAVRIEEMLNYFNYSYKKPANKSRFSINTELSDCPWNSNAQLLSIGIQGMDLEKTPASNLVFLIDTSGSMDSDDKIELIKKCMKLLSKSMTDKDRISIVTYSGEERIAIAGAKGNQIKTISAIADALYAEGVTNGESGIKAAYKLAEKYYIKGGNNRIILCTDGDLNVGITSESELKKLVEEKRGSGVYFSVMGFGKGNIKDNKMEALADNGNGSYHYIDTEQEAKKVLVEERNSTLFTIAKDVKIQVEFNPQNVESYRLIGYDNRRLNNEDFKDDTKDAGEIGAGHSVTALYEIIPAKGKTTGELKYQQPSAADYSGEMLTIKVRYKNPENDKAYTVKKVVEKNDYSAAMSDNMKLACAVTEFGLSLKNSDNKGTSTPESALELAKSVKKPDVYVKGFIKLVEKYIKDRSGE